MGNQEIYKFKVSVTRGPKVFYFEAAIKQKSKLPILANVQKKALTYIFDNKLLEGDILEINIKAHTKGYCSIGVVGSEESEHVLVEVHGSFGDKELKDGIAEPPSQTSANAL